MNLNRFTYSTSTTDASQPERPIVGRLKPSHRVACKDLSLVIRIINQLYDCVELRLRMSRHQKQHLRPPAYNMP